MSEKPTPRVLYVDNGLVFTNLQFDEDANISIQVVSPRRPFGHGMIERAFDRLNETLRIRATPLSLNELRTHIHAFIEKHNAHIHDS